MSTKCPICGSPVYKLIEYQPQHKQRLAPTTIGHCEVCNHKFSDPMPSVEAIKNWYQGGWYFDAVHKSCNEVELADPARWLAYLSPRLQAIDAFGLNAASGNKRIAYEIGCLEGWLVKALAERGWKAKGLEVNREVTERSRRVLNVDIEIGTIESWAPASASCDLIVSFHTFEHVAAPYEMMIKIKDTLRPGGVCILEIPIDDREFENPDHLQYFSKQSAERLMQRVFGNAESKANAYLLHLDPPFASLYIAGRKQ